MNWCVHFQISTPKRCRTTGLSLGRRGPEQRARVVGPFCQSTAKALAQCLPRNSALAKCRVEAELATIKGFSNHRNESQQRGLQSICWCAYVHLPVMIWTRRTLLGKNSLHSQVSRYTAKILSFQWGSKDSSKTE